MVYSRQREKSLQPIHPLPEQLVPPECQDQHFRLGQRDSAHSVRPFLLALVTAS